MTAVIS